MDDKRVKGLRDECFGGPVTVFDLEFHVKKVIEHPLSIYEIMANPKYMRRKTPVHGNVILSPSLKEL